jgi:hypothetical protein
LYDQRFFLRSDRQAIGAPKWLTNRLLSLMAEPNRLKLKHKLDFEMVNAGLEVAGYRTGHGA